MENRSKQTRSMVEAGLMSALITVIMLMNIYVPLFNIIGFFICPIIVTVLYLRHGIKVTGGGVFVSFVLVSTFYTPLMAIVSALLYGFAGISLGYCIKANYSAAKSIALVSVVFFFDSVLSFIIAAFWIDKSGIVGLIEKTLAMLNESMQGVISMYKSMGIPEAQLAQFEKILALYTPEFFLMMLPGGILIISYISSYINYRITKAVLKKLKYEMAELPSFDKIYVDNRIGALIVIIVCIGIILTSRNYKIGEYILNSSIMVLQITFLVSGVSIATYYLNYKLKISKAFRIAIIVFALFSQLNMVFVYLGIGDMIFDFRKVDPNRLIKKKREQ